ncbi:hypothetical protein [Natronosalvus vescus]|uniref:hypothetical protein n=1 Tax=Natronosalvus vescus TaxID=2953881 RepID=UPI002090EE13|nr:hypothetical protein [Natronosalvus vescus]
MLLLVASATLIAPIAAPIAAAQEANNSTATDDDLDDDLLELADDEELEPDDLDGERRLYIDNNAYITEWEHDGDTHTVTVGADEDTTVLFLPVIDTDEATTQSVQGVSLEIEGGNERTRTIDNEDTVVAMTFDSMEGISAVILDPSNDVLIGGPWTASDSRLSAIGAAGAIAFMTIKKELERQFGAGMKPEWLR